MKNLLIVQARMGSERLPGKVLREVKGKPLIVHTLKRLQQCLKVDHMILATSNLPADRPLLELARQLGVEGFAGSERDVLDRYYQAALRHRPDSVTRCTGDCPILDPTICDLVISRHFENGNDYTSNNLTQSYPVGYDVAVMKFSALERAAHEACRPYEREHVTPFIFEHPERFKIEGVAAPKEQRDPELRVTVDTQEDFELIQVIFEALYDSNQFFSIHDVLRLIGSRPELRKINAHIQQKDAHSFQRSNK